MKNIIIYGFLLVVLGFSSCGKSNHNNESMDGVTDELIIHQDEVANHRFNPPKWILGKWYNAETGVTYRFAANDICYITGGAETCFDELITHYEKSRLTTDFIENSNDTEYQFTYTVQGQESRFRFSKISEQQVGLVGSFGDMVVFIKQE